MLAQGLFTYPLELYRNRLDLDVAPAGEPSGGEALQGRKLNG